MQHIKIVSPFAPSDHEGPFSARGTKVFLNDCEVRQLTDIRAYWPVDGPVRVELEVLANKDLNFEHNAVDLHVSVICMPGYVLIEEETETGKRYTCQEAI